MAFEQVCSIEDIIPGTGVCAEVKATKLRSSGQLKKVKYGPLAIWTHLPVRTCYRAV